MRAHKYPPNYTVAEYQKWDGEWELIDGYPYAMSPSGTIRHQRVAGEVNYELRLQLKEANPACYKCCSVTSLDWIVDHHNVVRPDIVVTYDQTDDYITKPPILIVEVLSPATALKDRHLKYEIYEEQGVRYYVIIDPETKQFNIFELSNGQYQEHNNIHTFIIENECSIAINLEELLAAI